MDEIFDKDKELRQWFSLAKQNLDVAKHLVSNMHPTPVESICNNCQQSVEKYLKGYLFFNDIEPPKIHNLPALSAMCVKINPAFIKFEKQYRFLTNFGVLPKYPNQLQLTEEDANTAIRFAEEIKEFVVKIIQN